MKTKLVRCTSGAIYDVILDLRPTSPTFKQWVSVESTGENRCMVYIPEGVAHGFQTLEPDTEVFYQMGEFYNSERSRGVRWNDSSIVIQWPIAQPIMSARDQALPLLESLVRG